MSRLHLHKYRDEINTQGRFDDYETCYVESVYIHNSFLNISQEIGNNVLFYDTAASI